MDTFKYKKRVFHDIIVIFHFTEKPYNLHIKSVLEGKEIVFYLFIRKPDVICSTKSVRDAKNTLVELVSFNVFVALMFYNSFISRFERLILLVNFIHTHMILYHNPRLIFFKFYEFVPIFFLVFNKYYFY